jgi:precorrin-2 dehydrogenase / sirohydrochlorin ferrochelatase
MPASPYVRRPLFPMFLRLEKRECLVVGAGNVAAEKICGLLRAGACVRVIAPRAVPAIAKLAGAGRLAWHARKFQPKDLAGVFLVVAAASREVHEQIWREAKRANILCNVVDDPPRCDFFYPAVLRRGALQIAVSTGGRSPALAQQLRKKLERDFGPEYAAWVNQLGRARVRTRTTEPEFAERARIAHETVRRGLQRKMKSTSRRVAAGAKP